MTDLAAHGASPALAEPLHVGRPNIGDRKAFMKLAGDIFDRRWLTNNGPLVKELEQRIADHLGVKHCVAMCSGTIALEIAIRGLKLTGEVIVPSFTFIATAHALYWQSITPVFADIDPVTHNLDPASVRDRITSKTTGIIGVHCWGRPAPVDELQAIADEHGLHLMFDAAHAFGCSHKGRMIGGFGRAEVLSFHATKFFNTFEGGAVVTNEDDLAEEMRLMRNFGFSGMDKVIYPGTNGKLTEICAAMGLVNLDGLEGVVKHNRDMYQSYKHDLRDIPGLTLISYGEEERNNWQYSIIEIDATTHGRSRDAVLEDLRHNNILARRYFWPGCHRMEPYLSRWPNAGLNLSQTESVADRVIVLPTGAAVGKGDVEAITAMIRRGARP